jgi:hypothetical protein
MYDWKFHGRDISVYGTVLDIPEGWVSGSELGLRPVLLTETFRDFSQFLYASAWIIILGARGSYKPKGRGFDSLWRHRIFQLS